MSEIWRSRETWSEGTWSAGTGSETGTGNERRSGASPGQNLGILSEGGDLGGNIGIN